MPIRVVVVGAGLAGLTASHCLCHAGIDHIVLEKRLDHAKSTGASISIFPNSARILHQLGLLEELKETSVPLAEAITRLPDGNDLIRSDLCRYIRDWHGEDIIVQSRQKLLEILYRKLPKPTVQWGKTVRDVSEIGNKIVLEMTDGSRETADIVIGCDGVYSTTRRLMWANARPSDSAAFMADQNCFYTEWICLAGVSDPVEGLEDRNLITIHGPRRSMLFTTQPDATYFFVFFRLSERVYLDDAKRYTENDAEALACDIALDPISPTAVFSQVWETRRRYQLVPVEEGVLRRWHSGRIVLAGDSAHKMTPNAGLGGNASIESAVVICNMLRSLVKTSPNAVPALDTLKCVFESYQSKRHLKMQRLVEMCSRVTKAQAWDNVMLRILSTWVAPYLPDATVARLVSPFLRSAPRVEGIPIKGFKKGSVPWDDEDADDQYE